MDRQIILSTCVWMWLILMTAISPYFRLTPTAHVIASWVVVISHFLLLLIVTQLLGVVFIVTISLSLTVAHPFPPLVPYDVKNSPLPINCTCENLFSKILVIHLNSFGSQAEW